MHSDTFAFGCALARYNLSPVSLGFVGRDAACHGGIKRPVSEGSTPVRSDADPRSLERAPCEVC